MNILWVANLTDFVIGHGYTLVEFGIASTIYEVFGQRDHVNEPLYISQMLHGAGICTYIYPKNSPHVGKYSHSASGYVCLFYIIYIHMYSQNILIDMV